MPQAGGGQSASCFCYPSEIQRVQNLVVCSIIYRKNLQASIWKQPMGKGEGQMVWVWTVPAGSMCQKSASQGGVNQQWKSLEEVGFGPSYSFCTLTQGTASHSSHASGHCFWLTPLQDTQIGFDDSGLELELCTKQTSLYCPRGLCQVCCLQKQEINTHTESTQQGSRKTLLSQMSRWEDLEPVSWILLLASVPDHPAASSPNTSRLPS